MKVGLFGHGIVGSGVSSIIDHGTDGDLGSITVKRILVKDVWEITDERMTTCADDIINDPEIDTIVECMGGLEPAHTFIRKAIENGKNIVTSNKKMLASFFEELNCLADQYNVSIYYEATTGGGIPWICNLKQIRRIEEVNQFRGIFNGTTNYILFHMTKNGFDFQEALLQAQKLGYAERNPSDDIDGFDVRYKTMLSIAAAFNTIVAADDIPTFGIRTITSEDIAYAKEHAATVKLFGRGKQQDGIISACVMPVIVKNDNYLSCIPENLNGIESYSDTLGKACFIGQGAGSLPTAHAVVQDLITLLNAKKTAASFKYGQIDNSQVTGRYYIRTGKMELFSDLAEERASEHIIITRNICLSEIMKRIEEAKDDSLFIAEVIHD